MNHDIFISYSSKQKSIADGVCHYLEENGFKCWMAPRDIPVGSDYGDLIEDAIKTSKVVILVFSEAASISKWVKGEINVAFTEDKPILPFRVDETEIKGGFRVMLNQMHWIDAFPHYADRLPDLLSSICGLLGRQARKNVAGSATKSSDLVNEKSNIINGHEYVDLGLPSGTLWATCNVGSKKPEDYGVYLSWEDGGEVASQWGDGCSMPTKEQWEELIRKTKNIWTKKNGVSGRLFKAINGKELFLPAAGNRRWHSQETYEAGSSGNYWSSSPTMVSPNNAWDLYFHSAGYYMSNYDRDSGFTVRPVCVLK